MSSGFRGADGLGTKVDVFGSSGLQRSLLTLRLLAFS